MFGVLIFPLVNQMYGIGLFSLAKEAISNVPYLVSDLCVSHLERTEEIMRSIWGHAHF